jgi:hypothetical protein
MPMDSFLCYDAVSRGTIKTKVCHKVQPLQRAERVKEQLINKLYVQQ